MIRAVVFDLDGTLVDSDRDIAGAVNAALTSLGLPAQPLARVRSMIGHGARHLLASAVEASGASATDALVDEAREHFIAHYLEHPVDHTAPYPGIRDALGALASRGVILAIATNKPAAVTRQIVARLELPAACASADEVPARKPDPAVLRLALLRAGAAELDPREVVYVGDMGVDVQTARAYGARALGVAWGFAPASARDARPDAWAEHPWELPKLVTDLG